MPRFCVHKQKKNPEESGGVRCPSAVRPTSPMGYPCPPARQRTKIIKHSLTSRKLYLPTKIPHILS